MKLINRPSYKTSLGLRDLRQPLKPLKPLKSNPTYIEPKYIENIQGRVLLLDDWNKTPTTWFDHSGTGNDGTVYGATTPPPATPQALGYLFDGVDDYVDAGNDPSLKIGTGNFTVSAWVLTNNITTLRTILHTGATSSVVIGYWLVTSTVGVPVLYISNGTTRITSVYNSALSLNTWVNLISTVNRTGYITNYINGIYSSQTDITPFLGINITNSYNLKIGLYTDIYAFNGSIDEVRIYNRALSAAEIWSHYITQKGKFGL